MLSPAAIHTWSSGARSDSFTFSLPEDEEEDIEELLPEAEELEELEPDDDEVEELWLLPEDDGVVEDAVVPEEAGFVVVELVAAAAGAGVVVTVLFDGRMISLLPFIRI